MTTLQQYLNEKYPSREFKGKVKKILDYNIAIERKEQDQNELFEKGELDLSGFVNLEILSVSGSMLKGSLTNISLSDCYNLKELCIPFNNLTSIDFLNTIPHPEKLKRLSIFNNNIQSTDIEIFSRFVNLYSLKIGTTTIGLEEKKHNRFYGSLESYKNLTKLEMICIEATDVDRGLEWLPESLAKSTAKNKNWGKRDGAYSYLECSPHRLDVGCKKIQDALRPYDYDLEAWQLAHPHLMYVARPELFQQAESRNKWLYAIEKKIEKTQQKLLETKQMEGKEKKVKRLESKIRELNLIKENVLLKNKETSNKETQTDLTKETIIELLTKLEVDPKK